MTTPKDPQLPENMPIVPPRLAQQVFTLAEAAGWPVKCYVSGYDKDFKVIDFGDREPGEMLYVSDLGMVISHTCEYSGHNGDSYGDEYKLLPPPEAYKRLIRLRDKLLELAVATETKRLEDQERLRRKKAAVNNVLTRLTLTKDELRALCDTFAK